MVPPEEHLMLISVRHYEFDASEPYAEGQVLTAQDAALLNRVRLLQLRDNWREKLPSALLGLAELAQTKLDFAAYDAAYRFAIPPPPRMSWTLEAEIRALESEGYAGPDAESLARKRYTARTSGILTEDIL